MSTQELHTVPTSLEMARDQGNFELWLSVALTMGVGDGLHPLMEPDKKDLHTLETWVNWLRAWFLARTFEELLSLLHRGFEVEMDHYWRSDLTFQGFEIPLDHRVIHYLRVADGYLAPFNFRGEDEVAGRVFYLGRDQYGNSSREERYGLRQILAQKAYDMLAQKYFRKGLPKDWTGKDSDGDGNYGTGQDRWAIQNAFSEPLCSALCNFFRIEDIGSGAVKIRNLVSWDKESHNARIVNAFLVAMAHHLWRWDYEVKSYSSKQAQAREREQNDRMRGMMPWMIEVLNHLGRLDVLEKYLKKLDRPCLLKLRQIALREEVRLLTCNRKVRSVEEAANLCGSAAGRLCLKHQALKELEQEQARARQVQKLKKRATTLQRSK